jgi:hypothetical protein
MNTQLLDRYVTAVKFWLPKKQRDDIAAELAANLQAEIDDRAAELGRVLTDNEIAGLLKQHGSPMVMASRYQEQNRTVTFGRQLIGPVVFPFYWIAIKVTLVLLLITGIIPIFLVDTHGPPFAGFGYALVRIVRFALPTLVFMTLLFAVIDFCLRKFHFLEKWRANWDPRKLPPADRQAKQVRRSSSIAGIIIQSIFIVWWWNHASIPYLTVTNAGAQVHFAPILTTLHLPILIIMFINLAQHWINLAEPSWRWLPPLTGLVTSVLGLIILYPLLGTSPLISIIEPNGLPISAHETAEIQRILAHLAISIWLGILIVGAIYAWRLVYVLWQALPRTPIGSARNGTAHA